MFPRRFLARMHDDHAFSAFSLDLKAVYASSSIRVNSVEAEAELRRREAYGQDGKLTL